MGGKEGKRREEVEGRKEEVGVIEGREGWKSGIIILSFIYSGRREEFGEEGREGRKG